LKYFFEVILVVIIVL